MLTWTCRRFRARFAPGSAPGAAHPHRQACLECDAFAAAIERAAGVRLPLPAGLRMSLRKIAEPAAPAEGTVLPFPVPRLAVPAALAGRLSALATQSRPAPPEWVLNPRYAVAASALLALLLGPFFVRGTDRGLEALSTVREEVRPILSRTGEEGREEIEKVRTGAVKVYDAARRSFTRSAESFHGLSGRLLDIIPEEFTSEESTNPDPGDDEPTESSRRPQ
jgi:hypothetical protein